MKCSKKKKERTIERIESISTGKGEEKKYIFLNPAKQKARIKNGTSKTETLSQALSLAKRTGFPKIFFSFRFAKIKDRWMVPSVTSKGPKSHKIIPQLLEFFPNRAFLY